MAAALFATPAAATDRPSGVITTFTDEGLTQRLVVPDDVPWELGPAVEVAAAAPPAPGPEPPRAQEPPAPSWVHPLPTGRTSSGYGWRAAIPAAGVGPMFHTGIDLSAPSGTPVRAAAAGEVVYVGWGHRARSHSGWTVIVDHGGGVQTDYNHLLSRPGLEVGQRLDAGAVVGQVGSTGNSSGPHLHLSAWVDDEHVDPVAFFAERGVRLG